MFEGKLRQRTGRCIEYLDKDGKWKSTGLKNRKEAERWLMDYEKKNSRYLLFEDYAKGFFSRRDNNSYYHFCQQFKIQKEASWWYYSDILLSRYILPEFGQIRITEITVQMVQRWYLSMDEYSRNGILMDASRFKIFNVLITILKKAVFDGVCENNPCIGITKIPVKSKKKKPFTTQELALMFPENDEELINVWGSLMWAVMFLIFRDTGWRPGEITGLDVSCFHPEYKGIYNTQSVDSFQKEVKKRVKTSSDGGYEYRLGLLSDRTIRLLERYMDEEKITGLLFTHKGSVITTDKIRNIYYAVLDSLGIDHTNRPPYTFRTTFFSRGIGKYDDNVLMELMGHKSWHFCYDQRTPEEVLANINNLISRQSNRS